LGDLPQVDIANALLGFLAGLALACLGLARRLRRCLGGLASFLGLA